MRIALMQAGWMLLGAPYVNTLIFFAGCSILSAVQLFYFGTYLPHRGPHVNEHRARSNDFSTLWSFLTCYHFGYHLEHHRYPMVPWWRLPTARKLTEAAA